MLEPDFTPLPVYDTLKAYANQRPQMYPGTHQEDHWAVLWEGEWMERASDDAMLGGYHLAGQDATARVCVAGEQFQVLSVQRADQGGRVSIEKGEDGCFTLRAEAGATIDGFVVRSEPSRWWVWLLVLVVGGGVLGWGIQRWRRRQLGRPSKTPHLHLLLL